MPLGAQGWSGGQHCLSSPHRCLVVPVKVRGIYLAEIRFLSQDLWAFPDPRYGAP